VTSRSSKVVDFGTNRKRILDFILVLNSNSDAILPYSEILELLLYAESHFFRTPPLFRPKFRGVLRGVDPWCWSLQRANTQTQCYTVPEIIFEDFQPMSLSPRYLYYVTDGRTDRGTTCREPIPRSAKYRAVINCCGSQLQFCAFLLQSPRE